MSRALIALIVVAMTMISKPSASAQPTCAVLAGKTKLCPNQAYLRIVWSVKPGVTCPVLVESPTPEIPIVSLLPRYKQDQIPISAPCEETGKYRPVNPINKLILHGKFSPLRLKWAKWHDDETYPALTTTRGLTQLTINFAGARVSALKLGLLQRIQQSKDRKHWHTLPLKNPSSITQVTVS